MISVNQMLIFYHLCINVPPPPEAQMMAIWEKSESERTSGLISEWMSEEDLDLKFGVNNWRALMRFALDQKSKWRMIDDASDGHNFAYSASEQIHTTSAAAAAALTRCFREK